MSRQAETTENRMKLPHITTKAKCQHKYAYLDSNDTHYLFYCKRCLDLGEAEKPERFKEQEPQRQTVGFHAPFIQPLTNKKQ